MVGGSGAGVRDGLEVAGEVGFFSILLFYITITL